MSEFKFTPGPWSLCGAERGGCKCFTVGCDHHPICTVKHGEWGDSYPEIRLIGKGIGKTAEAYLEFTAYGAIDEEFAKGNAYLIAAAPEMYEALFKLRAAVDGILLEYEYLTECKSLASAALAKAENKKSG